MKISEASDKQLRDYIKRCLKEKNYKLMAKISAELERRHPIDKPIISEFTFK